MLLFFVLETYISLGSISFQEIMYLEEGLLYFQEKWADSYWKKTVKKQSISSMKQHWSVFCFVSQLAMITSMNANKWILDIISLWPTHIRPDSLPTENPVGGLLRKSWSNHSISGVPWHVQYVQGTSYLLGAIIGGGYLRNQKYRKIGTKNEKYQITNFRWAPIRAASNMDFLTFFYTRLHFSSHHQCHDK